MGGRHQWHAWLRLNPAVRRYCVLAGWRLIPQAVRQRDSVSRGALRRKKGVGMSMGLGCSITAAAKMRSRGQKRDASNGGDRVGGWAAAAWAPTGLAPPLLGCGRHEQPWTRALASSSRRWYRCYCWCWPLAGGAIPDVPLPRRCWANPANSVMDEAVTLGTSKGRSSGKRRSRRQGEQRVCEA